jgi:hypothetical protein
MPMILALLFALHIAWPPTGSMPTSSAAGLISTDASATCTPAMISVDAVGGSGCGSNRGLPVLGSGGNYLTAGTATGTGSVVLAQSPTIHALVIDTFVNTSLPATGTTA